MAKKELTNLILKLYSKLGGNVNEVLGTRSNISFLGTGKSPEGFIDSTINIDAIGALGKNKILDELKSSIGYLTADKLNDLQAGKLYENMLKVDSVFNPKQIPNITDLGTGIRNLDQEGLASLRKVDEGVDESAAFPSYLTKENIGPQDKWKRFIKSEPFDGTVDVPPPGSRGGPDDIAAPVMNVEDITKMSKGEGDDFIDFIRAQGDEAGANKIQAEVDRLNRAIAAADARVAGKSSAEIDALETMTRNKAGHEFITGYVDDIYKNAGVTASVDVAKKRAAAREFLYNMLKKETDLLPPGKGGTLESVISEADYKYITEGGGGALGDPLVLVKKYFGDEIARRIPLDSRVEIIDAFVDNVRFTKDRAGFRTDDPRFNPDDIPEFKHGGLAKILEV